MDIHAPENPIHSLKDFGLHIAVVTVGILIALGLEGVREGVYEHHLVRETRENVQQEMIADRNYAVLEEGRTVVYRDRLKQLDQAMPTLMQQHPAQVLATLQTVKNPGYIFSSNSWAAALSTGVLAHMSPQEVEAYAYAAQGIKTYTELQHNLRQQETRTKVYFEVHPTMNADQLAEAQERLTLLYDAEVDAVFFCPQMQSDIDRAIAASR